MKAIRETNNNYNEAHLSKRPDIPPDHRISMLFPGCRPSICQQQESSWSLLFRALDRIPKDFSSTIISAATSLEIPLATVVLSVSPGTKLSKSYAKLPNSIAYTLDPTLDSCLRPKTSREISSPPKLAKGFLRLSDRITSSSLPSLSVHSFTEVEDHRTVDISPFVQAVFSSLSPTSRVRQHRLSTKSYRKLCSQPLKPEPFLPPPYNPSIRPSWSTFWSLPLSHSCRTVWYRFLHHRIPHRLRLLEWKKIPSPSCSICQHPTESTDHFMFSCPVKLAVWQQVHNERLGVTVSITSLDLHHLLTTFCSYIRTTSDLRIIAATLESIWLSHWSLVFNDTPFTTNIVFARVAQKIRQHKQESFMAAGTTHSPPPFFSVDPV